MRVIAIWNLERSVGKTIAALALAENLATRRERRILLIDADSQGKLTALLHPNDKRGNEVRWCSQWLIHDLHIALSALQAENEKLRARARTGEAG